MILIEVLSSKVNALVFAAWTHHRWANPNLFTLEGLGECSSIFIKRWGREYRITWTRTGLAGEDRISPYFSPVPSTSAFKFLSSTNVNCFGVDPFSDSMNVLGWKSLRTNPDPVH